MSDGGDTRVYGQESGDVLDDEAPPEIPDITSDPDASALDDVNNIPIDVDPEPLSDDVPLSSSFRRLSPPPKPRRRERSITAPQTPTSRSFPPSLNDESMLKALKAPLIPSLAMETKEQASTIDLTRTQPSFAPPADAPTIPIRHELRDPPPVVIQTLALDEPPRNAAVEKAADHAPAATREGARQNENGAAQSESRAPNGPSAESVVTSSTPAILAMRIITVGEPSKPAAKLESPTSPPAAESHELPPPPFANDGAAEPLLQAPVEARPAAAPVNVDTAEEIADADVAPDSEDRPSGRIAIPAATTAAGNELGAPAKGAAPPPPPPPPRRPMSSSPSRDELVPLKAREEAAAAREESAAAQKSRDEASQKGDETLRVKVQRRVWWEELFNEDFVRATIRLSDTQVRREVDFIEESLGVAAGGVVLDLGCGSGHHAVELATRGYGVVGYDLSLYQLALAADVAQEQGQRINFLQGDMREMAFEEMFDGIFCWNTTFGYFDEEKNLAVAQRIFRALRPGGMFLLDVVNRDFVAAHQPSQVWYEGDSCVCMDDMTLDFISSRLKVKRSIILDDGRTRESSYSLRLYALHELGKLLHDVGFRVTEASGHPSTPGIFFGQSSPRIIILAQRP